VNITNLCIGCQMTLMGTSVTYTARAGKEQRDGIVVKHLLNKDKMELVDCSNRRHILVSLPCCLC